MCILGRLVEGLNFRENFVYFQNTFGSPTSSGGPARVGGSPAGGGLAGVSDGPTMFANVLVVVGGGLVVVPRWSAIVR